MINCLLVGIGGFIGAVLRYLLGLLPCLHRGDFPLATLVINFGGAFLIGAIAAWAVCCGAAGSGWVLLLKTGLCGGFTTFSTFSLETFNLLGAGKTSMAVAYVVLSVLICLAAVWAGETVVNYCFSA